MKYNIKISAETRDTIDAFQLAMDKFRAYIEEKIPQRQLKDMNIVYVDDSDGYEYNISYYDFVNTLDNQILVVLDNIERIEETRENENNTITV